MVSSNVESIVRRCQDGDKESFGILYRTFLDPMREVVAYYVHDSDAAWDILHDGFIIAFVSIDSLREPSKIDTWLTTIMKNLSLKYLNEVRENIKVSLEEVHTIEDTDNSDLQMRELTWKEIDNIINQLPAGYGKVFRLVVLEGLSHKEIGALLGISSHSSSSQLARAKKKMRGLIRKHGDDFGVLSIVAIILLLWNGYFRQTEETLSTPIVDENNEKESQNFIAVSASSTPKNAGGNLKPIMGVKEDSPITLTSYMDVADPADTIMEEGVEEEVEISDTIRRPSIFVERNEWVARNDVPHIAHSMTPGWSLSFAYYGNLGHNATNKSLLPISAWSDEVDVNVNRTEKTHYNIPLVVGVSFNKSILQRWGVEMTLRYTFLKSDSQLTGKFRQIETVQRIHYMGAALKFNYQAFSYNGFSLYGQWGGGLDIPIHGSKSVWEKKESLDYPTTSEFNLHPPVQWSMEGGLGIQYRFTSSFSIYAEPSLRYYFNPGSDIKTIRQEKQLEFTIPIGLRLTW